MVPRRSAKYPRSLIATSIAWRGRYLVVGFAQGAIPALPWNLALLKGASIVGLFWGDFARREPQRNAAAFQEMLGWIREGKLTPLVWHSQCAQGGMLDWPLAGASTSPTAAEPALAV